MIKLDDTNIMLDLETMGTDSTAPIIAIGAVRFDSEQILDGFYINVDLKSSVDCGATINPNTVMWWMKQSDGARNILTKQTEHIIPALQKFSDWLPKDAKVWGNGVDFDNVILRAHYDRTGITLPWKFWNNRCYRTMKNMRPEIELTRVGTYHNALHDAKSQALHLIEIMKHD